MRIRWESEFESSLCVSFWHEFESAGPRTSSIPFKKYLNLRNSTTIYGCADFLGEGSTFKNLTINFDNKRIIKNSCGSWSYNSYFQNFSLKNIQWKSEPSKCSTPSNWNIFEADFALFDYKIDISTNEKRINGHVTWWNSIRCNLSWQ